MTPQEILSRYASFVADNDGRPELQQFFQLMHQLSLRGMSISVECGEQAAIEHVHRTLVATGAERPFTLFDVGANQGAYSRELLTRFGSAAIIHAFEPSRETFGILRGPGWVPPNMRFWNLALGDRNGRATLFTNAAGSPMASLYDRDLGSVNMKLGETETVDCATLDSFCTEQEVGRIDFLKIDAEGHELKILTGAERLMAERRIRFVQFEFGGTQIDARVFFRDFWKLLSPTFSLYRILRHGLAPIERYTEELEQFGFSNFLAERKPEFG